MPELPMAASGADVVPAVVLQQSYHFSNFHAPTPTLADWLATLECFVNR
jgi:hypothetical protein